MNENRIILTRDKELLKNGKVTHGYWVRAIDPETQVAEIIRRFDLYSQIDPFHRCLGCNSRLERIDKSIILNRLKPKTRDHFDEFYICQPCDKVFWKGSHYQRMKNRINHLIQHKEISR